MNVLQCTKDTITGPIGSKPQSVNPTSTIVPDLHLFDAQDSTVAPIAMGRVTCLNGSVQKRFDLIDGEATKDKAHTLAVSNGLFDDIAVDGLDGLAMALQVLESNQALTLGVCGREFQQRLVTGDALKKLGASAEGAIARNKDCLSWPAGNHLLLLDIDPEPGAAALTVDEFIARLTAVIPAMAEVGYLVTESVTLKLSQKRLRPYSGRREKLSLS
jgi:hypothetical protein